MIIYNIYMQQLTDLNCAILRATDAFISRGDACWLALLLLLLRSITGSRLWLSDGWGARDGIAILSACSVAEWGEGTVGFTESEAEDVGSNDACPTSIGEVAVMEWEVWGEEVSRELGGPTRELLLKEPGKDKPVLDRRNFPAYTAANFPRPSKTPFSICLL